jgi:hypothetical protein
LSYTARMATLYYSRPDELRKHLAPEEIGKAAFAGAAYSSILPAAYDTTMGLLTGHKLFNNTRGSGLGSDALSGNPTIDTMNKIWSTASGAAQDVFTRDHVWTQKEVRSMMGLLPQYYGVAGMVHDVSQNFPKHNYLRPPQEQ